MADSWRNGLFDHVCGGDCGTCLGSWFCSPCLYGRSVNRLQHFPDTEKDHYDNVACNGPCWLFFGAGCCSLQWLPLMFKRQDTRDRFGIRGDGFTDCMASFCCTPCALAQMETELKDRAVMAQHGGAPPLGVGDIKQGYAPPPQGMNYQPAQ